MKNYMRKFIVPLILIMVQQNSGITQTIGKPAPEMLFSTALNNKDITSANLKNKYVVLDFWATWCGPCVASLPHFSELSDRFSSDSVVFAIISSEEKNKVRNFLSKRPVRALYLIDSITKTSKENMKINDLYGLTAQGFRVEGIPHTVVVDKYGMLRWVGTAAQLTPGIMEDILSGKIAKVQEEQAKQKDELKKSAALRKQLFDQLKKDTIDETNYKLIIAKVPYMTTQMSAGWIKKSGKQFVEFGGHSMDFLCFYFTRISYLRIKNFLPDKDSGYFMRFEMDTTVSKKDFLKTGLAALARACHISFEKNEVPGTVWTLQIADQKKFLKNSKPLDAASDHRSSDANNTEMIFNNFTLETIIPDLEDELKIFIEAGKNELNNRTADFRIPRGDIAFMSQKLFELYGFKLIKCTKKITITEIRQNL
jgi:thiol-disulfide isomerase/thioredoxin